MKRSSILVATDNKCLCLYDPEPLCFGAGHFSNHQKERRLMATTSTTARKPNAAFMKPLTPSAELAAVIGSEAVPRTEVTKKIWEYIKKHDLQDAANRRNINADDKLRPIFQKDQVSMFELTKLVNAHLK
jgi:chromatin remodeling complex protein RSC6